MNKFKEHKSFSTWLTEFNFSTVLGENLTLIPSKRTELGVVLKKKFIGKLPGDVGHQFEELLPIFFSGNVKTTNLGGLDSQFSDISIGDNCLSVKFSRAKNWHALCKSSFSHDFAWLLNGTVIDGSNVNTNELRRLKTVDELREFMVDKKISSKKWGILWGFATLASDGSVNFRIRMTKAVPSQQILDQVYNWMETRPITVKLRDKILQIFKPVSDITYNLPTETAAVEKVKDTVEKNIIDPVFTNVNDIKQKMLATARSIET